MLTGFNQWVIIENGKKHRFRCAEVYQTMELMNTEKMQGFVPFLPVSRKTTAAEVLEALPRVPATFGKRIWSRIRAIPKVEVATN